MTNASATVTLTREYDPWGNLLQGSTAAGYAFTGREWDSETGLYYYRARYYDPRSGRFLSEDPVGLRDGPNRYTYVHNAPVNATDPFGLTTQDCLDRAFRNLYECASQASQAGCAGVRGTMQERNHVAMVAARREESAALL